MLYAFPSMKLREQVPYGEDYSRWRELLDSTDPNAFQRIHGVLDARFAEREVDTSSWIPGRVWTGTPYESIYEAVEGNERVAALFFGLLVCQVVIDRPECWSSKKADEDDPTSGTIYFRIDCP